MSTIYFDEAGNTGAALLDSHQPIFVTSSVGYSNDEAYGLLNPIRTTQSQEIKFSALRKTENGRREIANVIRRLSAEESSAMTIIVHKKYLTVQKFVDLVAEPIAHEMGVDLYKQGYNLALSNLLFYTCPHLCGEIPFEEFLSAFVSMARNGTSDFRELFLAKYRTLVAAASEPILKERLAELEPTEDFLLDRFARPRPLDLDPSIFSVFYLVTQWGSLFPEGFNIVHDSSKPIFASKSFFAALFDAKAEPVEIGYDRRTFSFPLKATSLVFADSRDFPAIQLADLVAGATAYWAQRIASGENDDFASSLDDAGIESLAKNKIWPTPEVTPEALGTQGHDSLNPIDHMLGFLLRKN
jgi:Protein of unknown function (DUF3800)